MDEHLGRTILHLAEPFRTAPLVPRQCLVLSSGPFLELAIDISKELVHRRLIECPIVIPPPSYPRVALLCQLGKCCRCLAMYAPAPYRLPHPLQSIINRARQEAGESLEL